MAEIEYRNPKRNRFGSIDCEINHPDLGWIPFTADPSDSVAMGRELFSAIIAADADEGSDVTIAEYVAPAATPEQVKAEANRRIIAICPEWKQRNLLAQAAILNRKPMSEWTAEEKAQVEAGDAIWAKVEAIRAKSGEIEAMAPIPSDIKDDALWKG